MKRLKYFGTDGIRGVSYEKLTLKLAYNLGLGLKEAIKLEKVVIGYDTRESSPILANMIALGAKESGLEVIFAGIVSTPMIAYYSKMKKTIGIMVTASHNPYTDNGIKVLNQGYKTTPEEELIIEHFIDKGYNPPENKNFEISDDVKALYLSLIDTLELKRSDLVFAYDSAHGANTYIAKEVMDRYFKNAVQIGNEPTGFNINLKVGSTYLDHLTRYLKENELPFGFSYDGDGDRVLMTDKEGFIYDGDFLIYLLAVDLKEKNKLKNDIVVVTKMTNPGILKAFKKRNIKVIQTEVGDKYVLKAMHDYNASVGGEASGHIILKDILESGDGLLISLYILKILEDNKDIFNDIFDDIKLYPFNMVNIKNIDKDVLKNKNVQKFLDEKKNTLDTDDLFYIRASGTEPLLRVTISVKEKETLDRLMDEVVNFIIKEGKNNE